MVRLLVRGVLIDRLTHCLFQFQHGAITSKAISFIIFLLLKFQFQHGAITSQPQRF